jgi:NADPH:quinone reductase-like Zn-dependent oxidoreductase
MECESWILESSNGVNTTGELQLHTTTIPKPDSEQIIVAPIFGCVEANLLHAIQRQPIDICKQRGESFVIPGNACVGKVMEVGENVRLVKKGDIGMAFGASQTDSFGYPMTVIGYDAPKTSGTLSKRVIMHESQLIPLSSKTRFSLKQWAAFSARYVTAWSNWKIALRCWKSQMEHANPTEHFVCGWGGGTSLAELQLAKGAGFGTLMIASNDWRMEYISRHGITPLNRSTFLNLNFQPSQYEQDAGYRQMYKQSEAEFLLHIKKLTGSKMVAIFIDNIGQPVYRATLKALARQAVITTCGWKMGMDLSNLRAIECINRHIHVHTHYATRNEVKEAMEYAEETGWIPDIDAEKVYDWNEIPFLCHEYAEGKIESYFPIFEINAPDCLE